MLQNIKKIIEYLETQGLIWRILDLVFGGGKRFYAVIMATILYIFFTTHDAVTFGIIMTFYTAWAGLETARKGGD